LPGETTPKTAPSADKGFTVSMRPQPDGGKPSKPIATDARLGVDRHHWQRAPRIIRFVYLLVPHTLASGPQNDPMHESQHSRHAHAPPTLGSRTLPILSERGLADTSSFSGGSPCQAWVVGPTFSRIFAPQNHDPSRAR
jgi:hypothetical protein